MAAAGSVLSSSDAELKRAEIQHFDLTKDEIEAGKADCVVSFGVLCGQKQKDRILKESHLSLKNGGQLLFTDYVLADDVKPKELGSWPLIEPSPPDFWSAKTYATKLENLKFDPRVNEKLGQRYIKDIAAAWAAFSRGDLIEELGPKTAEQLLSEAEIWSNRVKAMEEGKLTVRRFLAIKKSAILGTMTEW